MAEQHEGPSEPPISLSEPHEMMTLGPESELACVYKFGTLIDNNSATKEERAWKQRINQIAGLECNGILC